MSLQNKFSFPALQKHKLIWKLALHLNALSASFINTYSRDLVQNTNLLDEGKQMSTRDLIGSRIQVRFTFDLDFPLHSVRLGLGSIDPSRLRRDAQNYLFTITPSSSLERHT